MTNKKHKNKVVRLYFPGGPIERFTPNFDSMAPGSNPSQVLNPSTLNLKVEDLRTPLNSKQKLGIFGSKVGGAMGAATNIIGAGISNAQIGDTSQYDTMLEEAESQQVAANSNDTLMNEWSEYQPLEHISWKDVKGMSGGQRALNTIGATGSGAMTGATVGGPVGAIIGGAAGLFSGIFGSIKARRKAKRYAKRYNRNVDALNERNLYALEDRADNIDAMNDLNVSAGYISAYGGPIHIKKENEGTFTDYCGGNVTQACINRGKNSPNALTRKRATFADNVERWYDLGGPLFTNGANWSNGLTIIGNGNTHENNPYEGVQVGVDNQGIPNLVEEGEVVWNDYVFSNRLKPTKEVKNKYKLKGNTFADVVKYLQKESEERPNDPISKRSLDTMLAKIANEQEILRQDKEGQEGVNYAANGGNIHKCGGKMGNLFAGTGKEPNILSNPYIPPQGLEYFTGYDNKESEKAKEYFHILNDDGTINWEKTYNPNSEYSKLRNFYIENWDNPSFKKYRDAYVKHVSEENKDIDLSKITLDDFKRITSDKKLGYAHDLNENGAYELYKRMKTPLSKRGIPNFSSLAKGLPTVINNNSNVFKEASTSSVTPFRHKIPNSWLRYMPTVGSAIGLGMAFQKPDYTNAEAIGKLASNIRDVEFNPIGNYLAYKPFDRNYYINKATAQNAATRRAINNNLNPSRNAAILGADYNFINSLGTLARQAEEYNLAQRQKVEDFNRGTNMYNSEGDMKAQLANMEADKIRNSYLMADAQMREEIAQGRKSSIYGNLTNLFNNLGAVGTDNVNRKFMNMLIDSGAIKAPNMAAKGGKLKRKKKGLTY